MLSQPASRSSDVTVQHAERLYYLDWLRVIATLGVFAFHAILVFSDANFVINNAQRSFAVTFIVAFFFPWGMPFFILLAGASSWFALRRRTPGQYARERIGRLVMPYVCGSILFTPLQLYLAWRHRTQTGVVQGTFLQYVKGLPWGPNPRIFGVIGYHFWFVGFLFCFALLTLPLFRWLQSEAGRRVVSRLARLCQPRGAILLFVIPLAAVRLGLHPFFPQEHNWADFASLLCFFMLGYLLFADQRFIQAVRRSWPITLAVGLVAFLGAAAISMSTGEFDIEGVPRTWLDFTWWGLITVCGWCWTCFVLFLGMRFMNRASRWVRYGQEAILPFYAVHQPVIVVLAYFIVQWNVGLLPKMLVTVLGSFIVSLGLYELVVRRVPPLRAAFGMKPPRKMGAARPEADVQAAQ